jgi:type I restriction enzyme, S subunit
MSERRLVTLGGVARLDVQTVEVRGDKTYPIVGVLNRGRGLLHRDAISGSETAYKTLNVIRPGQIVYSRLKAFEGAITVVPHNRGPAFASQEFPTFTCSPDLLPEYFALLTTTATLWDTLQNLSTGMGGRRERVKPAAFLSIRVYLPAVVDQRRIVAVMSAVDAQIEALKAEAERTVAIRRAFEAATCHALADAKLTTLSDIADVVGGVTKDAGRSDAPGNVDVPYLRVANVQRGFLDLSDVTTIKVPAKTLAERRLQPGDLLLNEGGDRDKLGRGWIWEGQIEDCIHQNHVHRARIVDQESYLPEFVSMWANTFGPEWFFNNGGQTSGIASVSIGKVRQFPVPVVDVDEQHRIVGLSKAVQTAAGALAAELAALRIVRADLLASVLSQELTVDEMVDQFVKAV